MSTRTPWWAHPAILLSVPVITLSIIAYAVPEETYAESWRTWKFFDVRALAIAVGSALLFAMGALLSSRGPSDGHQAPTDRNFFPKHLLTASFLLTLFGYVAWAGVAVSRGLRPGHIVSILTGSDLADDVKQQFMGTVSGVTTLTQFGIAYAVLAFLYGPRYGWRPVKLPLAVLGILALMRALLNSERLAVIEMVVPAVFALITSLPAGNARMRRIVSLAPVFGPVILFVLFTTSEYFRSWRSYYSQRESSLIAFSAVRLTAYYVTALNNGACLEKQFEGGFGVPYYTLNFGWRLPLVKDVTRQAFDAPPIDGAFMFEDYMGSWINVEFNNPSGIFVPTVDFGVWVGLAYWLAAGLFCGWLYKQYRSGRAIGICLYPLVGLSLIETSRVLYWVEGRAIPAIVFLLYAAWVLTSDGRPAELTGNWPAAQIGDTA